jgi:hypothetical protein
MLTCYNSQGVSVFRWWAFEGFCLLPHEAEAVTEIRADGEELQLLRRAGLCSPWAESARWHGLHVGRVLHYLAERGQRVRDWESQ